jgi:predicted nucleic acid-binding protein
LNLYLDSSALLKRYLVEAGSEEVRSAIDASATVAASRIAFVESMRGLGADPSLSAQARRDWRGIDVVEVSSVVCERALGVALSRSLKTLDAIHLASALVMRTEDLTFATFDRRLHAAAKAEGFETLPEALS